MPKKPDQEPEVKRYVLLTGTHTEVERDEDGKIVSRKDYSADGDNIVESKRDLITLYSANRFKLVSDDVTEMKTGPALEEDEKFSRLSSKEKAKAGKDSINKVTEEKAAALPGQKHVYREDHGYEQPPPKEEQHNDQDERKTDLGLPAKRTSAERTTAPKAGKAKEGKEAETE